MNILCLFMGHEWRSAGWTSSYFDETVPAETPVATLWRCSRCSVEDRTFETGNQLQARFDGYRKKYGDSIVVTDEFHTPKPK